MEDARPYLNQHLTAAHYEAISQQVCAGYAACAELTKDHPLLGGFLPAVLLRSYLITPFVDHSLTKIDGFTYEFRPNAANNWYQTTLYSGGLALTSHFMGTGKNKRSIARRAVIRGEINARNGDFFAGEKNLPDIGSQFGYCHVLHGGYAKADSVTLAIPTRDQRSYFAVTPLEIVEPETVKVEEIREEVIVKLISLSATKNENVK